MLKLMMLSLLFVLLASNTFAVVLCTDTEWTTMTVHQRFGRSLAAGLYALLMIYVLGWLLLPTAMDYPFHSRIEVCLP